MSDPVRDAFSAWIQQGFDVYRRNLDVFLPAGLIAGMLSLLSLGVLAGPLLLGLAGLVLARLDDRPATVGDLFSGFHAFLPGFLFALVWGGAVALGLLILVPLLFCIGPVVGLLAVSVVGCLVMFAPFLIVDRGMGFWDASVVSINFVKGDFWPFLGFGMVALLVGVSGSLVCLVGLGLTAPLGLCMLGVAYRDLFGEPGQRPSVRDPSAPSGA